MKQCFFIACVLFIIHNSLFATDQQKEFTDIIKVSATPVKNQQKTGTCWSYATASFLESELLRMGKGAYDLSEMYFVRLAYINKAKMYLKYHGKTNFSQGGQAHDVINILKTSGLVPESDYLGNEYDPGTHNHKELEEELIKLIKKTNKNFNEKKLESWEKKYIDILDSYLGKVPESFNIKGQNYEPASLLSYLQIDPEMYIEFTSYSHHPFYEKMILEIPDNWSNDCYYNIPVNDLIAVIDSSLHNGYSVCWDGDNSEKGFKHSDGIAVLTNEIVVNQQSRQQTFLNRKTTDDHLMHMIGISENESGEQFYYIKNSWGTEKNKLGGYLYMSKDYAKLKTVAILVHKDAVPENILKKLKL